MGKVKVSYAKGEYQVEWPGTRDDTIRGYEVYRRCAGSLGSGLDRSRFRAEDPRNRGTYRFRERAEAGCHYAVAALDSRGSPGP